MTSLELKQKNLTTLWAELIIEELIRLGVRVLCIAPGSRSTPLVAAAAKRTEIEKVICQDERSAAFFALGAARAQKKPAAVIVTSGSAVANLFPAVVEAANDGVPLLLLTADRPPELRSVGANQCIDQVKIFGDYVRAFVDLPVPDASIALRFVLASLDDLVHKSQHPDPGPVHLNCMYREPFVPAFEAPFDVGVAEPLATWRANALPLTQHFVPSVETDDAVVQKLAPLFLHAESGVIVAGAMDAEAEQALLAFAEHSGWPILPDVLSNLRFTQSSQVAHFVDMALLDEGLQTERADVVLQVGGRLVSKRLQTYIDHNQAKAHLFVSERPVRCDPGCRVTHQIHVDPASFVESLTRVLPAQESRSSLWHSKSQVVQQTLRKEASTFSEIHVAKTLYRALDANTALFVSSSMPIRDLNMFADPHPSPPRLYANRGASGIDGIISTACGVSKGLDKRTLLFCGDLSFLHDTNGLSLLKSLVHPMVIVVVNNRGGGIFTMLDIYREKEIFTPYFDAEHDVKLAQLCAAYDVKCTQVKTLQEWEACLKIIPTISEHTVIEVCSDKHQNQLEHERMRKVIHAALSE